jgi:predicted amidohydrolase
LCTGQDVDENIDRANALIRKAAQGGANFIATPEMTHLMELSGKPLFSKVHYEDDDPGVRAFAGIAKELGVWLLIGSLAIRLSDDKVANRSFLFQPDGEVKAIYDKIHMFDVDLDGGESYRESKHYQAGTQAVIAELPWASIGLTVCYDLRFPYLHRLLAHRGASILAVPAAFTKPTGQAHWHILLRARAIENACYVVAPAQGGVHENGRETFGHSLIISPWGEILAEGGEKPCVISAMLDPGKVAETRGRIPSLNHDRAVELGRDPGRH